MNEKQDIFLHSHVTRTKRPSKSSSGGGSSSSSDYTVRFDSNGGSKVNSQTVDRNSTVKDRPPGRTGSHRCGRQWERQAVQAHE